MAQANAGTGIAHADSGVVQATGRRRRLSRSTVSPWFGLVFVVVGIVVIGLAIWGARENARLDAEGVTVQGQIFSRSSMTDSDGARSYTVGYEFVDPATGAMHRRSTSVDSAIYGRSREGQRVMITFVAGDPGISRLGPGPFAGGPEPWLGAGFGGLFALAGVGLTYTLLRERRRAAAAAAAGLPLEPEAADLAGPAVPATPDQLARTDRFTRSAGRVVLDSLGPPLGGLGFLGFALFALTQVGSDPMAIIFVGGMTFFGVLLLSATPAILQRGLGRTMLRVGPDGLEHRDLGFLRWSEIQELRIERNIGSAGEGLASYLRLGIVPLDPSIARSLPGGLARGMASALVRFANDSARRNGSRARVTELGHIAPLGIYAFEIEEPFADLVASVRRFAPVMERAATEEPRAPVAAAPAPPGRPEAPVTADELSELDALLGQPSAVLATAGLDAILHPTGTGTGAAGTAPARHAMPASRTFWRRGARDGPLAVAGSASAVISILGWTGMWLAFSLVPLVFVAHGVFVVADGELLNGLMFIVGPSMFSVFGIGQVLATLGRAAQEMGEPDILRVGPGGITAAGLGYLEWREIAEVTVDDDGDLTIRPAPGSGLDDRSWAQAARDRYLDGLTRAASLGRLRRRPLYTLNLGLLDADPDEVVDAIATYRVVDEV